ncbi:uncharacterized protein LOC135131057 isoform X2 [Zophobas morio]|uniref:uncharacterized protein LOC135131057 isoform X2 n=1 Tax=Zophobas morio TaxID=2755281 RepID=UPI0030833787
MQKIVICLFFFVIATSQTFFIQSKDLKKILQYFPKAFEVDTNPRHRQIHHRHRENDNRYRDEYVHDNYDRSYDSAEHRRSGVKNPKGKVGRIHNDKALHHSHIDCDHPDHHHHHHQNRYPSEDRVEKYYSKNTEEMNDHYSQNERRSYQDEKKKVSAQNDKDYEQNVYEKIAQDKQGNLSYKNKDYVTGVLIAIPKIKNDEDADEDEDHIPSSSSYLY